MLFVVFFPFSLYDVEAAFFTMSYNIGGMASKGLRATFISAVTNFDAGYYASQTTETLIGYTAC
jgi:hypothetical protein